MNKANVKLRKMGPTASAVPSRSIRVRLIRPTPAFLTFFSLKTEWRRVRIRLSVLILTA